MKTRTALVAILLVCTVILIPEVSYSADVPSSVTKLVSDAKKAIKTVNMDEFKNLYDKKALGILIDVRDPNEYASGHIPRAINISRGRIEFDIWKRVGGSQNPDMETKMMLYCGSGGRCALAAKSLTDLGFSNVTAVEMKLADWKKAGYPFGKQ